MFEFVFAPLHFHQFYRSAGQRRAGGNQIAEVGVNDGLCCVLTADDHVITRMRGARFFHAETRCGVGLRVKVAQKHPSPGAMQRRSEIDGRGCLSHAALLIDNSDNPAHRAPSFLFCLCDIISVCMDKCNRVCGDCFLVSRETMKHPQRNAGDVLSIPESRLLLCR